MRRLSPWWIMAVLAALTVGGKKVYNMTRILRNHNPGNIRLTATQWQGQVPATQQTDPDFVQFTDPLYGIRAIERILLNYAARGLHSVQDIIRTWAPPNENDTAAYIADVARELNVSPTTPLTTTSHPALIGAIIRHENGAQPYSDATLRQGIALA